MCAVVNRKERGGDTRYRTEGKRRFKVYQHVRTNSLLAF